METASDVVRWVGNASYLLIGAWTLRAWWRERAVQTGWLAATFGSLAAIVTIGLVSGESDEVTLVTRISLVVLVAFPYLLLRFLDTFERVPRRAHQLVAGVAGVVVLWSVVVDLPADGEPRSAVVNLFVALLVAYWFGTLGYVGLRFFRGGRGQPTLARRRLRLLGVAAVTLGLVLLLAGLSGSDPDPAFELASQLLGMLAAWLFLVAFAPPAILRIAWRQPEEQGLLDASVRLMGATEPHQVAAILAPHLRTLVGASGAAVVQHGRVMGRDGVDQATVEAAVAGTEETTAVPIRHGTIHLWTSRYTPFFGAEELRLMRQLALLADLALDRTALMASEREARAGLEVANAELESFVHSASHDLKSPLIAMLGFLEVLESDHGDDLGDEGRWYVERMIANGRYMEALIQDLLELSRVGRMNTEPSTVAVGEVVRGLAADLFARFPGVRLVVHDVPDLHVNPTQLRQLLGNLLENAATYAGRDDVTIEVGARLPDGDGGGVELWVRDDGQGIPEEYRERIFGVFERLEVDDEKSGTGIGLAICRKIVEHLGGRISVADSAIGADFRIVLPPSAVLDHASAGAEEVSAPAVGSGDPDLEAPGGGQLADHPAGVLRAPAQRADDRLLG